MNKKECQHHIDPVSNRLKKLTEANRSLAEIESLDEVLLRLMDLAKEVTDAEASLVLLYNPKRGLLEIVSIKDDRFGEKADELFKGTVKMKIGEGIAGWVAKNHKSVMVEDAQADPRFSKKADRQRNFTTRSLICVPLVYRKELLGVLSVLNSLGKPFFDNEDLAVLESFADLASVAIIRARLLEQRIEQEHFRTELEAAAKIQKLFWPKMPELGEGSHVWGFSEPATSVGGDLYDVIPMPDASWLVYVADVAGKGLSAALMMAALSAKIRSIAPLHKEVDKLLASVNKEMYELMSEEGFFATMVLGKYWPKTGRVQIARAGHPYPLWIINNGFGELPKLDGIPIGVKSGTEYEKTEFVLSSAEALLFITDGVTEAENQKSELFGDDRLTDYFKEANGPPWADGLLERIDSWRGNAAMNDDLTMLEIWRDPPR
jgi:sigma-B regulation protein RsbU (phosphoserine phosphatase)